MTTQPSTFYVSMALHCVCQEQGNEFLNLSGVNALFQCLSKQSALLLFYRPVTGLTKTRCSFNISIWGRKVMEVCCCCCLPH